MSKFISLHVQPADRHELDAVKSVADACRNELGFVVRASLEKAVLEGELLVARRVEDQFVLGFAWFHCTRSGYVTIYEIAVHPEWRGVGVGKALINRIAEEAQRKRMRKLRLKCPVDLPANGFYSHLGFNRVAVEDGRHRALAIWEKDLPSYSDRTRSLCA